MTGVNRNRLATVVGALAFVAVGVAFVAYRLATPSDHAALDYSDKGQLGVAGRIPVLVRDPIPGGLLTGDLIVAIEGVPLADVDRGLFDPPYTVRDATRLGYRIVRGGESLDLMVDRGAYPLASVLETEWSTLTFMATMLALGVFVFWRRPDDPAARAMLLMGAAIVGSTGSFTLGLEGPDLLGGPALALDFASSLTYLLFWAALLSFAVEFARPPSMFRRWRPFVIGSAMVALVVSLVVVSFGASLGLSSTVQRLSALAVVSGWFGIPLLVAVPIVFVLGYRTNSDELYRSRVRWVAAAFGVATIAGLLGIYLPSVIVGVPLIPWSWSALLGLPIPIAIAVAILRHGAFDIRIVVNRSIVYGGLTLVIVGIYVAVVAAIGAVLGLGSRTPASLLAAGVVAVVVQPLRETLQRATNRLMFGDRDDPYAAISRLSARLDASLTPEDVLPAVQEAVARALRVPYARVELHGGSGAADDGVDQAAAGPGAISVPLVDQGRAVGRLVVAMRPGVDDLSEADRRLLDDLARQAASAAHAVLLVGDLQRAREREVRAREEERRLLRRQLHDDIGTALAALGLRIEAARHTVSREGAATARALDDVRRGVRASIDEIRRIVGRLASDVDAPEVQDRLIPPTASVPNPPTVDLPPAQPRPGQTTRVPLPGSAKAALVAGFGIMALALVFALYRFNLPADGWRLTADAAGWGPGAWQFVLAEPGWGGPGELQAGDRIAALGGRPIDAILDDALAVRAVPPSTWSVGSTVDYTVDRAGRTLDVPVVLITAAPEYVIEAFARQVAQSAAFALLFGIGLFVILRRPDRLPARLLWLGCATISASLLLETVAGVAPMIADLWYPSFWVFQSISGLSWPLLVAPLLCHLFLVFPKPARVLADHQRLVLAVVYGGGLVLLGVMVVASRSDVRIAWRTFALASAAWMGILFAVALVRLVREAMRERDYEARAQARWVAWGLALLLIPAAVSGVLWATGTLESEALLGPTRVYMLFLPATLAIAIVQHRLFDIDVVINRTLVYGALTGAIVVIYVATVTLLGEVFAAAGFAISFVATGVVAVLVQPIRERLQLAANRLMYGERDDPYTVVSRLGQRLDATVAPDALLPAVAETLATALRVPYVAIELELTGGPRSVAVTGQPVERAIEIPLAFQRERVGRLLVGPRWPGETFSAADRSLIDEVARHASRVAYAIRLRHDLDVSRELIAQARIEERRRIRRDLHDDLGPSLAAIALKLETAAEVARTDARRAASILERLPDEISAAVREIRRIVNDLRPPALDELGLVNALNQQVDRLQVDAGTQLSLTAATLIPPLPAAVEVAAYRIILEAVTNAVRHAHAQRCSAEIGIVERAAALRIDVVDDGRGLPDDQVGGIGLRSMRERATELGGTLRIERAPGGGTQIAAELPLPAGTVLGQAA